MSKLREPKHREKWSQCEWQSTILVQRLRKTRCSRTETWLHRSAKRTDLVCLSWTLQYARDPTHFWCESSDAGLLAKKKPKPTRNLKTHFCQPNLQMCWKPMKCGHLSTKDGTNAGCGRSCAVALVKSWPLLSVIAARRVAASSGSKFHKRIRLARVTAISGKLINLSFLKRPMRVLAKAAGRQTTWSVGITPWGNRVLVSLEKRCPFQNLTSCTKSSQGFLLFVITYHLLLNHYQIANVNN